MKDEGRSEVMEMKEVGIELDTSLQSVGRSVCL